MSYEDPSKTQNIQVISRAALILRALARDPGGLSLGQIASRVDLPRSTVQRIVGALGAEGFVFSDGASGGIRLGPAIQTLAQASAGDLRDRLRPLLQRIADQTGETVDLAVLEQGKMRFIDQVVGSQRLRTVSSIGESFPLTTTANGKAALACLDPAEAARLIFAELQASGNEARLKAVLDEIEQLRSDRLAVDLDEHTDGISAMGFARREISGEVVAISVPVPSSRFPRVQAMLTQVLQSALQS